jgi:hypothetical protein
MGQRGRRCIRHSVRYLYSFKHARICEVQPPKADCSSEDGGVIFVLEKAFLEAAKVGKNYQLLNCDDHATFLKKHKRDPALYRPDILHQVCLHLEINGSNPKLS